jgi:hypothetical protein
LDDCSCSKAEISEFSLLFFLLAGNFRRRPVRSGLHRQPASRVASDRFRPDAKSPALPLAGSACCWNGASDQIMFSLANMMPITSIGAARACLSHGHRDRAEISNIHLEL